ncbi:MAG: transglutaminase domain-containing protein [Armatimonadetes bacterium]|nr:transglutaminase domain-containing protein [Armatimonadota bacterium]
MSVIPLACLALLVQQGRGNYDALMRQCESLIKADDYSQAEAVLRDAVHLRYTETAMSQLAWVIGRQGRFEECFELSAKAYVDFGPTAGCCHQYAEAALGLAEVDIADKVLKEAERRGYHKRTDWLGKNLASYRKRVDEWGMPSEYELYWDIPFSAFPTKRPLYLLLPTESTSYQKFSYEVDGAAKVVRTNMAGATFAKITPKAGKGIHIRGKAMIWPRATPPRILKSFQPRRSDKIKSQSIYYYNEEMKLTNPELRGLSKSIDRSSWYDTSAATLDWIRKNITYGDPPEGNDLEVILRSRKGICHHISYLYVAMMRSLGYEAYVRGGYVLPDQGEFKDEKSAHGWVTVMMSDGRSVEMDPQNSSSLIDFSSGSHYLRVYGADYEGPISNHPEYEGYESIQGWGVSGRRIK